MGGQLRVKPMERQTWEKDWEELTPEEKRESKRQALKLGAIAVGAMGIVFPPCFVAAGALGLVYLGTKGDNQGQ